MFRCSSTSGWAWRCWPDSSTPARRGLGLPAMTPAPAAVFGNTAFTGALVQGLVGQLSGGRLLLTQAEARAIAANLRPNHVEEATNTSDLKSVDLFGDVTVDVTDRLEVSAGPPLHP